MRAETIDGGKCTKRDVDILAVRHLSFSVSHEGKIHVPSESFENKVMVLTQIGNFSDGGSCSSLALDLHDFCLN